MRKVIIPPTTAAVTHIFDMNAASDNAIIQVDSNIIPGENISIEQENSDGSWGPIFINAIQQQLNTDTTQMLVLNINKIRINKPVTAAPIGIVVIV